MENTQKNIAETIAEMQMFDRFHIGLPVFWNGSAYRITARLRYRVRDGKLTFWYELAREDKALEDAAKEMIDNIKKAGLPLFFGNPFATGNKKHRRHCAGGIAKPFR